ncbi:hypothetical protein C0995_001568 [Termitomyces sp. Mi166|nr:hypothetical protein C0995_001568 [Termitomyces sp. Mi166\
MSSMESDQRLVRELALANPARVVPCFGYHPWFSYRISVSPLISKDDHYRSLFLNSPSPPEDHITAFEKLLPLLPDPVSLTDALMELRRNLEAFPEAMLGEVGLDRVFRVPYNFYAEQRHLTPFVVPFDHQLTILEAQINLAVELGRNISLHSVKCQLGTVDLLDRMKTKHGDKWSCINLDLHSCGVSPETWRDRKHKNVFLSLSTIINGRSPNHRALIASCSPDRILAESDFNDIDYCAERTCDMVKIIAEVKGWSLEMEWNEDIGEKEWGTVRKLERNWLAFKTGRDCNLLSNTKVDAVPS